MVHSNRGNYRRGAPRGYRPPVQDFPPFSAPVNQIKSVYDLTLDGSNLGKSKNSATDPQFDKEILDRGANLTPSVEYQTRVIQYAKKVIVALEKEREEHTLPEIGISYVGLVGSFATETSTHSSDKSDVVVQVNILPSYETTAELGRKLVENMKLADPKETGEPLPTDYGCLLLSHICQVRILFTINPHDAAKLEPGLHLDVKQMMLNYFAIRHAAWFSEMSRNMPQDFQQEYRALVRVLKDVRSRYKNFKPMSLWTLQYISFYCLVHGPNRQKVSLGTAFRRFFELIASGALLPKVSVLNDPTAPNHRIGFDLSLEEMDTVCIGAQTIVRILATGNDGYRTVLGIQGTPADLTQTISTWNGIEIKPGVEAYKEGCMDIPADKIPV
ncbi:unnamed protein product [Caenorhabditis brenneri]